MSLKLYKRPDSLVRNAAPLSTGPLPVTFSFDVCGRGTRGWTVPQESGQKGHPVRESRCNLNFLNRLECYYNCRNYVFISLLNCSGFHFIVCNAFWWPRTLLPAVRLTERSGNDWQVQKGPGAKPRHLAAGGTACALMMPESPLVSIAPDTPDTHRGEFSAARATARSKS